MDVMMDTELTSEPTDIAIVGMSGRFPGASDIDKYWDNLCRGIDSRTVLVEEQLRAAGVPDSLLENPDYVRVGYPMEGADQFDAAFFGYSPREARFIDPQQRVLLECAFHALENAGYAGGGSMNAGVYVGCSLNTYLLHTGLIEQFQYEPVMTLMSNDKDFLATRVGYKLDLHGPCVTVQSACSTSLVAVHMACQSLLSRECDMALAGGVCVKVPLMAGYLHRDGGMLSVDGRCRPFDAQAKGTIFGSGVGVIVLKLLTDATADGDTVHAVIRGTATNNDGRRKASFTAPSVVGVGEALSHAIDFAGIRSSDIGYVECHGTGTILGDPVEVHGMARVFGGGVTGSCIIGSVKGNIGHLESASGIAGLIKAVCCLKHRYIPQTLHYVDPNPALALQDSPFFVNAQGRAWEPTNGRRLAAVNSLGVGGTNASAVLEEAMPGRQTQTSRQWHMLPVSAAAPAQLQTAADSIHRAVSVFTSADLADSAFTLSIGRRPLRCREVIFASEAGSRRLSDLFPEGGIVLGRGDPVPVVHLFCGDDALDEALQTEPVAKAALEDLRYAFTSAAVVGEGAARFLTLSHLLMSRLALLRLWSACGLQGQLGLGDALGALCLACAAGHVSIPDALYMLHDFAKERLSPSALVSQCAEAARGSVGGDIVAAYVHLPSPNEAYAPCTHMLDRLTNAIVLPLGCEDDMFRIVGDLIGKSSSHVVLPPLRGTAREGDPSCIALQAAALWSLGAPIQLASLYAGERRRRVPLPATPLLGKRHWYEPVAVHEGRDDADKKSALRRALVKNGLDG
jgi:phthiocerol/phenolphthiocerol synthesis type-I polyketide synthase E